MGWGESEKIPTISPTHAKEVLKNKGATLLDATEVIRLSSTSRLHDLFVCIEGMTSGEFINGGKALTISYSFSKTLFGNVIIASTFKGICFMAFYEIKEIALLDLKSHFPNAEFIDSCDMCHVQALKIFDRNEKDLNQIKLHLKGTDFQLKAWDIY